MDKNAEEFYLARAKFREARAETDTPHVWDDIMDHAHDWAADRGLTDGEWSDFMLALWPRTGT